MATPQSAVAGDGEEDDPVVKEIEVFVSQELADQLYLLQFPLRSHTNPPEAPALARYKPKNSMLELEYPIEHSGDHYDEDADEDLQQDYTKYTSMRIPQRTQYVIGVYREGQLHLNPIKSVLQMRPSFTHLDVEPEVAGKPQAKKKAAAKPKSISVQYKKRESDRSVAARETSFRYLSDIRDSEAWQQTPVAQPQSFAANSAFEKLFAEETAPLHFQVPQQEYITALSPAGMEETEATAAAAAAAAAAAGKGKQAAAAAAAAAGGKQSMAKNHPLSLPALSSLPALEQLSVIMTTARVITYSRVRELVTSLPPVSAADALRCGVPPPHTTGAAAAGSGGGEAASAAAAAAAAEASLLVHLQSVACLVQGCWVLRSEALLGSCPAELLLVRDMLLSQFAQGRSLTRAQLLALLPPALHPQPPSVLTQLLREVAVLDGATRTWSLALPRDDVFSATHPGVVAVQGTHWAAQMERLAQQLSAYPRA